MAIAQSRVDVATGQQPLSHYPQISLQMLQEDVNQVKFV
jgi:hypothetical protein